MTRWLRRSIVWIPITLGLFAMVLWRTRPWEGGTRLQGVSPGPLLAAIALNGIVATLWAVRSADLLRAAGRSVSIAPLIPMTALANTINNLTPGSVGELLRLYLLHKRHGVDYPTGAAVVLIERVVAIVYLAVSAGIAWIAHIAGIPDAVTVTAFVVLAGLPAVPYGLGIRPSAILAAIPLGPLVGRARWARATHVLARIDSTIGGLLTDPARLVVFAGTTALILATYAAQLLLVARAAGLELDPAPAWGALGLSITIGVLSFLPFGLGATDLVLATLLGTLDVPPPTAAAIVLGYRLTTTLPLALAGSASYGYLSATLPPGGPETALREASAELDASPAEER